MSQLNIPSSENMDSDSDDMLQLYRSRNKKGVNNCPILKTVSIHDKNSEKKEKPAKKIDQLSYTELKTSSHNEIEYCLHHPPKYTPAIYQNSAFDKYSLQEQVKLLCSYHTKISKIQAKYARLQLECVPLPKTIKTTSKMPMKAREELNGNNLDDFDFLTKEPDQEYVSRSGRITKRKFYSEATSNIKKAKVTDGEWINITKTSPPKPSGKDKKPNTEAQKSFNKSLSTAEIMNKSSLFKDKEPRNTRMAKIAEGVEQINIKDKIQERAMEIFERSLSNSEEAIEDNNSISEENVVKRRVVPPLPKPKAAKKKQQQLNEESYTPLVTSKSALSPNVRSETSITEKTTPKNQLNKLKYGPSTSSTPNARVNKKMVQCPICSRNFGESEIENHASSCGENMTETRSHFVSKSCSSCDEVFLSNKEYEEHIKSCMGGSYFN